MQNSCTGVQVLHVTYVESLPPHLLLCCYPREKLHDQVATSAVTVSFSANEYQHESWSDKKQLGYIYHFQVKLNLFKSNYRSKYLPSYNELLPIKLENKER